MHYKNCQITHPCSIRIQAHDVDHPKPLQLEDESSNSWQNIKPWKKKVEFISQQDSLLDVEPLPGQLSYFGPFNCLIMFHLLYIIIVDWHGINTHTNHLLESTNRPTLIPKLGVEKFWPPHHLPYLFIHIIYSHN